MQYGVQKSSSSWRITMQLRNEPRCPGCSEFLQPCVIEFRNGWAWCPVCVATGLHAVGWIGSVLGSDTIGECSTVVNGLRFYTPDLVNNEAKTAYEWAEDARNPMVVDVVDGVHYGAYGLTPSGEQLLADLDVSELQAVESDLKRVRNRER